LRLSLGHQDYDEAGHLFALRRGTTRYYVATDEVGTPRVVLATNGTVAKSVAHDAFGNQTADSAPSFELPFGFAGGGQFCINDEGFSLCAEAGFGVGSDLSADTGGLAEDTESIIAEAGASAGPIGVKVGAEFDNTGCLSINDPELRLGESAFAKIKDGKVKFGYKQKLEIKNGPDALLKMGKAKIAGKFCRKALW
jgi:hypothetical protein